eukprot:GHVL01044541.1.p1 GENE.GHVL01044541.1~~GHVL01044541.1.p1  ORF type:complete len:535 (-),score=69.64 GHVL01044541.1:2083-3687(-)
MGTGLPWFKIVSCVEEYESFVLRPEGGVKILHPHVVIAPEGSMDIGPSQEVLRLRQFHSNPFNTILFVEIPPTDSLGSKLLECSRRGQPGGFPIPFTRRYTELAEEAHLTHMWEMKMTDKRAQLVCDSCNGTPTSIKSADGGLQDTSFIGSTTQWRQLHDEGIVTKRVDFNSPMGVALTEYAWLDKGYDGKTGVGFPTRFWQNQDFQKQILFTTTPELKIQEVTIVMPELSPIKVDEPEACDRSNSDEKIDWRKRWLSQFGELPPMRCRISQENIQFRSAIHVIEGMWQQLDGESLTNLITAIEEGTGAKRIVVLDHSKQMSTVIPFNCIMPNTSLVSSVEFPDIVISQIRARISTADIPVSRAFATYKPESETDSVAFGVAGGNSLQQCALVSSELEHSFLETPEWRLKPVNNPPLSSIPNIDNPPRVIYRKRTFDEQSQNGQMCVPGRLNLLNVVENLKKQKAGNVRIINEKVLLNNSAALSHSSKNKSTHSFSLTGTVDSNFYKVRKSACSRLYLFAPIKTICNIIKQEDE